MIRKILEEDRQQLTEWLRRDEALNMPILGDLARHGLDSDYHEIWSQSDDAGHWNAIIRRFFEHFILYAPQVECDWEELGFFLRFSDPASVSGSESSMEPMIPYLDGYHQEAARMMILAGDANLVPSSGTHDSTAAWNESLTIGYAGESDAAAIGELIFATDAFRRNYHSVDEVVSGILSRLRTGGIRHAVLRKNGWIVSHANTTAETDGYALISGVTTQEDELRRGHAARLVSWLCRHLLSEGRQPCLYCKSPAAYAMYQKLGFVETGTYVTCRREI